MLLLLLASRFVEAGFFSSLVLGRFELLGAEHGYYRWARPGLLLRGWTRPMAARRRAAGRVLCNFNFCAACGARAAAYQALFAQRLSGCQGFVLQIALAWYPLFFAKTSISRRKCVLWCAKRLGASAVRH